MFSQFTRKVYTNDSKAFFYDWKALEITKSIIEKDKLKTYKYFERLFIILPLFHSEDSYDAYNGVQLL